MKTETLVYSAAAVVCTAWMLCPARSQAAKPNFNLNFNGDAETCADLKVTSRDGEIARLAESFTMTRAEAPLLELNAGERGNIRVRGWNRPDYSVETCKIAVAGTRAEAEQLAHGIAVTHAAGRLSFNGPASDTGQWAAVFLIHAPTDAGVDLEARNGPISVRDLNGTVKLRATNGPIAIQNCGGNVEAHTVNGPIAFTGNGGEAHLRAQNGPIALNLGADSWNGAQLEARTINGPLAVNLPDNFRSGLRLETDGHSPLSCNAEPCRNAFRDGRNLQMNGSNDTIRLSTENGPVAIRGLGAKDKAQY